MRMNLICQLEEANHDFLRYLEQYRLGKGKEYRQLARCALEKAKLLEKRLNPYL